MQARSFLPHVTTGITKTVAGRERAKAASSSISGSSTGSSFTLPRPRKTKETKGPAGKRLYVRAVGSTGGEPEERTRGGSEKNKRGKVREHGLRVASTSFPALIGRWLVAGARHSPETQQRCSNVRVHPRLSISLLLFLTCVQRSSPFFSLSLSLSLSLSICLPSSSLSSLPHTWTPGQASSPVRSLFFFVSILS